MHTRTTADYSPLRGPIMDDNGRDVSGRSKKERQEYEQAVNARRDMLKLLEQREYRSHDYRVRRKKNNVAPIQAEEVG